MNMNQQIKSQHQASTPKIKYKKPTIGSKLIITILLITSYIIYRFTFKANKLVCIYDAYHQSTFKQNRDFVIDKTQPAYQGNINQLSTTGKAFIGTGQVMMDLWIAFIGIFWLLKLKNIRILIAIGMFYLIRGVIFLNIQKFPFPQYMAWRSPGFFSFTVPYDHTRDFYFSGHTGGLTLIFVQVYKLKFIVPSILSFLSLIFMMNMLLMTRVHYSIDIIGGFFFAIWFHRIAERILIYVDKLFSLPFVFGLWIIKKLAVDQNLNQQNIKELSDKQSDKANSQQQFKSTKK